MMDVFFIGTDNAVWFISENTNGTWNVQPIQPGGAYVKQLTVAMNAEENSRFFYIGGDNAVLASVGRRQPTAAWLEQRI